MQIKYIILLFSLTLAPLMHGVKNDLLRDAIIQADVVAVKNLFKYGKADIHDTIGPNIPPLTFTIKHLYLAARNKDDARKKNLIKIMEFLLRNNALANQPHRGEIPLLHAMSIKDPHIIKMLLWYDADIDVQDNEGNTTLHLAVLYNAPEIVSLLLEHGANTRIKNTDGLTAYDIVTDETTYPDIEIDRSKMHQIFNKHAADLEKIKTHTGLKKIRERETVKPSCDMTFTHT